MAQYNLINTGMMVSSTTSGTGNKSLTGEEIAALYDGNTTSSGISLLGTDILYLDIDLGFRARLDDVKLVIDVPGDRATALTSVYFYYKTTAESVFILGSKDQDATTFYMDGMQTLFAPRYIRIIVDSIECDIHEVQLLNDEAQVSFGEDGNTTLLSLVQEEGYDDLGIFNNSAIGTKPINAYVMVDYQGNASDSYIQLSNSLEGPYVSVIDGVDLTNSDESKAYSWDMGYHDNTTTDSNDNVVSLNNEIGYYTTPLFDMFDRLNNTYLMVENTLVSGTSNSWSDNIPGGSMLLRSSDAPPLPFNKLFWWYREVTTNYHYIYEGDMTSGFVSDKSRYMFESSSIEPVRIMFDRKRSQYVVLYYYPADSPDSYRLRKYSYIDTTWSVYSSQTKDNNISANMDIDSAGNVWGYVQQDGFRLVKFDYTLATRTTMAEDDQNDFLVDMSANKNYNSCWYTDKTQNKLELLESNGTSIASVSITSPTYVTSLPDGGCFVIGSGDSTILRFDMYGVAISSITYSSLLDITALSFGCHSSVHPYNSEVFWMVDNNSVVYQLGFDGTVISDTAILDITSIDAFPGGCLVYCSTIKTTYQLNEDGDIARTWDFSSYDKKAAQPFPVVIYYDDFITMNYPENILPLANDPYWSIDSFWNEVPMRGEKLIMKRYHRLKFKLTPEVPSLPYINLDPDNATTSGWSSTGTVWYHDTTTDYKYVGERSFVYRCSYQDTSYIYQKVGLHAMGIDSSLVDAGEYRIMFDFARKVKNTYATYVIVGLLFFSVADELIKDYWADQYSSTAWGWDSMNKLVPIGTRHIEIRFRGRAYQDTASYNLYIDALSCELYRASASINKVIIPRPVVINDIKPQEFKNVYIKTDVPAEADVGEYETKLKCWWGNEEE